MPRTARTPHDRLTLFAGLVAGLVWASEGAWGWALLVPASLVGGLLLGVAFSHNADRVDVVRSRQPR